MGAANDNFRAQVVHGRIRRRVVVHDENDVVALRRAHKTNVTAVWEHRWC